MKIHNCLIVLLGIVFFSRTEAEIAAPEDCVAQDGLLVLTSSAHCLKF